jgi:alkyldihydroxyacetonephosphate synthase
VSSIRPVRAAYTAPVTVAFDPLAWAAARGHRPGESILEAAPPLAVEGTIDVDVLSLAVDADPALPAVAVERRLREHGLTLGLFPERYESAAIRDLVADDDPGAGASGPGFASLVIAASPQAVTLAVRRRPEVQAGRGLLIESIDAGAEVVRRLAQDGLLPEIAVVADPDAADLLLAVAGDPDGLRSRRAPSALAILIAAGRAGEAALRLEEAIAAFSDCTVADLGQNVARAWAGSRYDLVRHADVLAAAGIRLEPATAWHRWSELPAALGGEAASGAVGRELLGAGPHGVRVLTRRLS